MENREPEWISKCQLTGERGVSVSPRGATCAPRSDTGEQSGGWPWGTPPALKPIRAGKEQGQAQYTTPHPPFLPRLLLQTWDLFHSHFKSNTLPERPLVPRCENWRRSGRCALPGPACLSCVPATPSPGPQVLEIRLAAQEAGAPEGFNEAKPRGRSENQCQLSTKPALGRASPP